MTINECELTVLYSGDPGDYRRKRCGLSLVDQMLMSVSSLRRNWSVAVEVLFVHTLQLNSALTVELAELGVRTIQAPAPLEPRFLMANKILAGLCYIGSKDLLFLDCDTIVHQTPYFDFSKDLLVAYDVLQPTREADYRDFFAGLQLSMPEGVLCDAPAYEYYYNNRVDLFPTFNSGVFFLKQRWHFEFFSAWRELFSAAYNKFSDRPWSFYLEQMSFTAAIAKLRISASLFPKGINFICTPRAPSLRRWNRSQIIIEHYAGDTSRPLMFDGDFIDLHASGVVVG